MKYYTKIDPIPFKKISSQDYLRVLKEESCSDSDKESVIGLLFKYNLPEEVLNVILHYLIRVKNKRLSPKLLEKFAITFVEEKINTSEEAISYLERNEIETRLNSFKTKEATAALKDKKDMLRLNSQLDETVMSFKKRCSVDHKKSLMNIMNQMIIDAFRESH